MNYSIEIVPRESSNPPWPELPPPITVQVPKGAHAIYVMEKAVDIDKRYKFIATWFGKDLGYFPEAINGIPENINTRDPNEQKYYWRFFADGSPQDVGVSTYPINGPTSIVLRYTKK